MCQTVCGSKIVACERSVFILGGGINYIIIPLLCHFTILGQKNAQNMPGYCTVEQGKTTD